VECSTFWTSKNYWF